MRGGWDRMARESMRVGLLAVGSELWLGGVYYIMNLIRAVRSLPDDLQPSIVLIVSQAADAAAYADVEALIERVTVVGTANGSSLIAAGAAWGRRVKRAGVRIATAAGRLAEHAGRAVIDETPRPLLDLTKRERLSLLFPCIRPLDAAFPTPWLAWAWDLQHRQYPEFFSDEDRSGRDHIFTLMAAVAPLIVLSSHTVRHDFNRWYPGVDHKLRVLSFATAPVLKWYEEKPDETAARYGLPPRYVMVANQFWIHKNHRAVFEALALLNHRSVKVQVVCTGHRTDHRRPDHYGQLTGYLREHHLTEQVRILGVVPRSDQIQLMRRASAVLQPSFFEGWSSVVEDARALGKRMVLSDIPVHREQAPPNSVYFDPLNPEALAERLADEWAMAQAGPMPPSLDDEQASLESQQRRVIEYGRRFMEIAGELGSVWAAR
jgi:glycosyltransferase involved in cell wall biosynthesis